MRLPPATVGPKVDVTVPVVASARATTCLEYVDGRINVLIRIEHLCKVLHTTGQYMLRTE